jgi:hypothetical protein
VIVSSEFNSNELPLTKAVYNFNTFCPSVLGVRLVRNPRPPADPVESNAIPFNKIIEVSGKNKP